MQRHIIAIAMGPGKSDFDFFFRQSAVYLRYSSETVTLIRIALFQARRIPVIPTRYPMLKIFIPSTPGSLWALATLTNLNRGHFILVSYWVIHTWTVRSRNFQGTWSLPRSTPWLASQCRRTPERVPLQSSDWLWWQPTGVFWWLSVPTWRPCGDWRLSRTVCWVAAGRPRPGWGLTGTDSANKSRGS